MFEWLFFVTGTVAFVTYTVLHWRQAFREWRNIREEVKEKV
jgi:hypothetical protein